jgi:hypothetical protein
LLEKQSTNIATYSEDFSNAAWYKADTTLSANASISPDGTQTADRFYETATNGSHGFYQNLNISTGTDYTFSCYVKKGNRRYCGLQMYYDIAKGAIAFFDLDNGTLVYEFYEYPGYLVQNSKITSIGNDWYRLEATIRVGISDSYFGLAMASSLWSTGTSYDNPYTGDTSKYIDVWGFQIEQSSYGTSYIPTTSTSVTRLADSCYKTGISSLIGQTEGTIFLDFYASGKNIDGLSYAYITLFGDSSNNVQLYYVNSVLYWHSQVSGSVQFSSSTSQTILAGQRYKICFAYKSGQYALYVNGVSIDTNASTAIPTMSTMNFNTTNYGANPATVENKFNQVLLFQRRLTNTELAQLTTL